MSLSLIPMKNAKTKKIEKKEFFICGCGGELEDITALGDEFRTKFCVRCNQRYYWRRWSCEEGGEKKK